MKKLKNPILLGAAALLLTTLNSCNTDPTRSTPAGEERITRTITLDLAAELANEPAPEAVSRADEELTFTIEAWTCDENPRCVMHQTMTGSASSTNGLTISLVPGVYDLLFWADHGTGRYTTNSLREVALALPYVAGNDRDAFACALRQFDWGNPNTALQATLSRPVAKLTVRNTSTWNASNTVAGTYGNVPSRYDVLTGISSAPIESLNVEFPATTPGSDVAAEDFLFVPEADAAEASLSISVGASTKTLDQMVLKKNYKTNITTKF